MRTISNAQLTTSSVNEADLTPGNVIYDDLCRKYIKCKAASSIVTDTVTYSHATAATKERGYLLPWAFAGVAGKSDSAIGWNKTGQNITVGHFFWCMVGPIVEQVVSDGVIVVGSRVYVAALGKVSALPDGLEGANLGTALTTASGNLVDVLRRDG
jgi:hypothetical protein